MADFHCARCGNATPRLAAPPMPGAFGVRVYEQICASCWHEWLRQQTAVINHYGLNLRDPQAKRFLTQQTETFLFGAPHVLEDR
jgi:Fe-S cluster biosynthesis and repair protein YggX